MGWNRPPLRYLQISEIKVPLLVCRKASSCKSFVEESLVPHSPLLKRENTYSNPPKGQKGLSFRCSKLLLCLKDQLKAPEWRVILSTILVCKKNGHSSREDLFAEISINLLGANRSLTKSAPRHPTFLKNGLDIWY